MKVPIKEIFGEGLTSQEVNAVMNACMRQGNDNKTLGMYMFLAGGLLKRYKPEEVIALLDSVRIRTTFKTSLLFEKYGHERAKTQLQPDPTIGFDGSVEMAEVNDLVDTSGVPVDQADQIDPIGDTVSPAYAIRIGQKIKTLRKQEEYTQYDLAQRLGCSLVALGQLERGESVRPDLMARAIHVLAEARMLD